MTMFHGTGGPVSPEDSTYIERKTDWEAFDALEQGDFCHIIAPCQMGKTSLLCWLKNKLVHQGWQVAYCDLASIKSTQAADWYNALGKMIFLQLEWKEVPLITCAKDFKGSLVESLTRDSKSRPIALFFDEVEGVNNLDFAEPFFSMLRTVFNPVDFPVLSKVRCALAYRAYQSELIKDQLVSPFNIGHSVWLGDFTYSEVQKLASQLAVYASQVPSSISERIYHWAAGHPYLTQKICSEIERRGRPATEQDIDQVVSDLFFDADRPDFNILHIRKQTEKHQYLLSRIVVEGLTRKTGVAVRYLCNVGALKRNTDRSHATIRNPIYARIFQECEELEQEPIQQHVEETQQTWDLLTEQIKALKRDIALEMDGQKQVVLQKRLDILEQRRGSCESELWQLRRRLSQERNAGAR